MAIGMEFGQGFLERNNPNGARDVYVRGLLAGTWTPDDSHRMLAMQDDPEPLMALFKEASRDPAVSDALAKMVASKETTLPKPPPRPWLRDLGYADTSRVDEVSLIGELTDLSNTTGWRRDKSAASVKAAPVPIPGVHSLPSAGGGPGKGYDPYRNHGKFAPGPHKARPKSDDVGNSLETRALDAIHRALETILAELSSGDRADDLGHGYNQNRAGDGRFAQGAHHDKKADRVQRAHGNVARAAWLKSDVGDKRHAAETRHAASTAAAAESMKAAKMAGARAKRSPTAENVAAWHSATQKAIRDRSAAQRHGAEATRYADLHDKAEVTHAIAQAKLHEAQRSASQTAPTGPRSIELHPHGVGFERIPGEGDHAFEERSPSPEFSFSPGMARIHGEGEHAVIEPPKHEPPPPKESGLDILSRTRPHYVHVPVVRPEKVHMAEDEREHQENIRRQLKEAAARIEAKRSAGILSVPGVAAVYLPDAPKKR